MQSRFPVGRLILIGSLLQAGAYSQPSARPEFEVASIKPSRASSSGAVAVGTQTAPDTVTLTGIKTRDLIARAYSLNPYQITGPDWLDEELYDIVAKSHAPVPDSEQRLMLQSLLAARFGLSSHTGTRELACYELVVDKAGLKIKPASPDDSLPPRYFPNAGATAIRANSISLKRLADLLTPKADRPVLDKTGVSGAFDIDLKWANDLGAATDPGPSLFTAVREQLGLNLEGRRNCSIETLFVDKIDRPSGN